MADIYTQIQEAITRQLDAEYPDREIYADVIAKTGEVDGGSGAELPGEYFFVDVVPVACSTLNRIHTRATALVDIVLQLQPPTRRAYFAAAAKIDQMFRPVFRMGDRAVTVSEMTPRIVDGVLHNTFTVRLRPDIEVQEDADSMDELEVTVNDRRL